MIFQFDNVGSEQLIIVMVGYMIVFLSLLLLCIVFYNLPRVLGMRFRRPRKSSQQDETPETQVTGADLQITGEETAAISAAIFLFVEELHDTEHTVLTIHKISRRYSPWNSKIYNVTNGLNKRF